jgi:3-hydroxybutyryl-CoA dehydrogenase
MGSGIAQLFAENAYEVAVYDSHTPQLERAKHIIDESLARKEAKGSITADDRKGINARIAVAASVKEAVADSDLVIEAIRESEEDKRALAEQLVPLVADSTLVATNTSSISITRMVGTLAFADRFIGMHFMNPVPVMQLVEIIRGHRTSDDTVRRIVEITKSLQRVPVLVNDYPGFVSNRLLMPLINEAIWALHEGVADIAAIDTVMQLGMNHPMGPLKLADFIGLDVCLSIMNVLHQGMGNDKYAACPLLIKMVDSGNLGRKSGSGFYDWQQDTKNPPAATGIL